MKSILDFIWPSICKILSFQHVSIKIPLTWYCIFLFFQTKSSDSSVYCDLSTHLNSHWSHFSCSQPHRRVAITLGKTDTEGFSLCSEFPLPSFNNPYNTHHFLLFIASLFVTWRWWLCFNLLFFLFTRRALPRPTCRMWSVDTGWWMSIETHDYRRDRAHGNIWLWGSPPSPCDISSLWFMCSYYILEERII